MIRVHVICEGQTEETFVNDVMQPAMSAKGIHLYPSLIGRPGHKGGNIAGERAVRDVRHRLLGDSTAYCTTFFDYYGIHAEFPGRVNADPGWTAQRKFEHFRAGFQQKIIAAVGEEAGKRFIPYVQMYEFEGLLFTCPHRFAEGVGEPTAAARFQAIRDTFETPEHINDSAQTAPSKRVSEIVTGYQKPVHGILAALEIGLGDIRLACAFFDQWLTELEALDR